MALALAEKYKDFALMIEICDREGNHEKLEKYKGTLVSEVPTQTNLVCFLYASFLIARTVFD